MAPGEGDRVRAIRRRQAAILALVVAGSASIATSPAPQPVATKAIHYEETFALNAATPVAVRRLSVLLATEQSDAGLDVVLAGRIEAPGVKDGGVRLTIVPDQGGSPPVVDMIKPGGPVHPQATFFTYKRGFPEDSSCPQLPCARTYRVVVELANDQLADGADVTLRAEGELTVSGVEQVPAGTTFSVEPVDELLLVDHVPGIKASSKIQDVEIGGPDRQGAKIHAVAIFKGSALPANPVWPVVPELVLHVEAATEAREVNPGQLALKVEHPGGSAPGQLHWVVFALGQLPFSVNLQPIAGCQADLPCSIPIDATLDAQSPGDLVHLRWWVEARVRYFAGAAIPAGAAVSLTTVTEAGHTAEILAMCADEPELVLFEARRQGIVTEESFLEQVDQIQAETWDPASVQKLDQYDELCVAAIANLNTAAASPSPPPSEIDPFAPRAEASLAEETLPLSLESPVFVRDIRLTRNAAAADPAGAAAIGYLRIVTTAPTADPRTYLNAFVQVLRVDGREPVVRRYDIPASSLAGPPLEVDPWVDCEALAACTVDLRVVLSWWDNAPLANSEVSWQLKAGMVWPGLPKGPAGAQVTVERIASLNTAGDSKALTAQAAGADIVLSGDRSAVPRRVEVQLNGAGWPAALTDIPMPGHGLFTVSATATGTGPAPIVATTIGPADQSLDRGLDEVATVNAGNVTQAFFPFNTCKGRVPCVVEYTIEFTRVDKGGDYGPVTVGWSLEAVLRAYESIQLPPGAKITIQVAEPQP